MLPFEHVDAVLVLRAKHSIADSRTRTKIPLALHNFATMTTQLRKGEPIRFIGGKYIGYKGYFNLSGDTTNDYYPVIVLNYKKASGVVVDKVTKVRKDSVKSAGEDSAPKSRAEAILQQHPRIEKQMNDLCRMLAQCELNPNSKSIQKIFASKMKAASEKQLTKGSSALYKRVVYDTDEIISGWTLSYIA